MKWAVVAILFAMPSTAVAEGFVTSRAMWDRLTDVQRESYAMGAMHEMVTPYQGDGVSDEELKGGYQKCLTDRKLTGAQLAAMISEGYRESDQFWGAGPNIVLRRQLYIACRSFIPES